MDLEEKKLEGAELARDVELEEVVEGPEEETELPVIAGEEVHDIELAHRGRLFDAMQLILAGDKVSVSALYLPQRETEALEFLQTAVSGKDTLGMFVYAEDRASLFEQALAVLQENITHGNAEEIAQLEAKYGAMSDQVSELRHQLSELAEAQDDEERLREDHKDKADDDKPPQDKPPDAETKPVEGLADYLRGPEISDKSPHVSTLDKGGPEAPPLADHVSTLGEPV
jgi:hypothetical protein